MSAVCRANPWHPRLLATAQAGPYKAICRSVAGMAAMPMVTGRRWLVAGLWPPMPPRRGGHPCGQYILGTGFAASTSIRSTAFTVAAPRRIIFSAGLLAPQ
jgi:hypothetical protein